MGKWYIEGIPFVEEIMIDNNIQKGNIIEFENKEFLVADVIHNRKMIVVNRYFNIKLKAERVN
jgi:hypothetical protein